MPKAKTTNVMDADETLVNESIPKVKAKAKKEPKEPKVKEPKEPKVKEPKEPKVKKAKKEPKEEVPEYLRSQIITYMGNKRKILPRIEEVLIYIKKQLGKDKLTIGDGFSGSGIVSRMFKKHASDLYTNDLAGYSRTLNSCYLATPSPEKFAKICEYVDEANKKADEMDVKNPWISKHWTGTRAYYTETNGKRIDAIREYIQTIPEEFRDFVMAPLLVECSIHANTNGQFASFFKGGFGGKTGTDLKRITQDIRIPYPIFDPHVCNTFVTQMDVFDWVDQLPPDLDVIYYDPPYNKHPYDIYYFLLDIINLFDTFDVPHSYRGQPSRLKSSFNSSLHASYSVHSLINRYSSKFIIFSYFDRGIIPFHTLISFFSHLHIHIHSFIHPTYNRLAGLSHSSFNTHELLICASREPTVPL
jgi:adenine-specific DNA-methyltransferase